MADLKVMLTETIQNITEVADLFYQQNDHEAYQNLNSLLITVSNVLQKIYEWDPTESLLGDAQKEILRVLGEAMHAMETKDSVLLADILQYDLKEQFENVLEKIN